MFGSIALLTLILCRVCSSELCDQSLLFRSLHHSQVGDATEIDLRTLSIIRSVSIYGTLGAFELQFKSDNDQSWNVYQSADGLAEIIRSSNRPEKRSRSFLRGKFLANSIKLKVLRLLNWNTEIQLEIFGCQYNSRSYHFSGDQIVSLLPVSTEIASSYYNDLYINFRTLNDAILLVSEGSQADMLLVQIRHGRVEIIYDFGSQKSSLLSGGVALDDGSWHELYWSHQFDQVHLYIDGRLMDADTPASLYRKLDLDSKFFIGGHSNSDVSLRSLHLSVNSNLTGCIRLLNFNQMDLLVAPRYVRNEQMPQQMTCLFSQPEVLTLSNINASISFPLTVGRSFSIQFRTFSFNATLLSFRNNVDDELAKLQIIQGNLLLTTSSLRFPSHLATVARDVSISNGQWFSLFVQIAEHSLSIDLDSTKTAWIEGSSVRSISLPLTTIRLSGFVGCLRSLQLANHWMPFLKTQQIGSIKLDQCRLIDACWPNPCENAGVCIQEELQKYRCDCANGYSGAICHSASLPHSCEEYFLNSEKSAVIEIDLDGGDSLKPFKVNCNRRKENGKTVISTELHHNSPPIEVRGFSDAGGLHHRLNYSAGRIEIGNLVEGFVNCRQLMNYECYGGAQLMSLEGNPHRPSSWYVGRNGHHGLQWGAAEAQSRMCSCALNGSCINGGVCNCDSGQDTVDSGFNTDSHILPVMELFLGGTDLNKKSAKVTIGSLQCSDRVSFSQPLAFLDRDVFVTIDLTQNNKFDVSLYFRTTHSDGTLIYAESVDATDWIKIFFKDEKMYGQSVAAGKITEIVLETNVSDNEWHWLYFESVRQGLTLKVDRKLKIYNQQTIPPITHKCRLGSSTNAGGSGFAGLLRSIYVNGRELNPIELINGSKWPLSALRLGTNGQCAKRPCFNGGQCVEMYDTYRCNCSMTAYHGTFCTNDIGLSFSGGVQVKYSMHPGRSGSRFSIGFQTESTSVSILQASGLFSDATLNLTINQEGHIEFSVSNGRQSWMIKEEARLYDDGEFYQISFHFQQQKLLVSFNNYVPEQLEAESWQFLTDLDVWKIADSNFTGCLSRLSLGESFPFRHSLNSKRLSVLPFQSANKLQRNQCPTIPYLSFMQTSHLQSPSDSSSAILHSNIRVRPFRRRNAAVIVYGPIVAVFICSLILAIALFYCYIRSRPDGVYKTNEDAMRYATPNRSDEPLVLHARDKEYFC